MREVPSGQLLDLLKRLGLASRERVLAAHRQARKMARDVPLFDSVWVDALMNRRVLTPFQASEINAGRGEQLSVGSYVLMRPRSDQGYVQVYEARSVETRTRVDIVVVNRPSAEPASYKRGLDAICLAVAQLGDPNLLAYHGHGVSGERLWIASAPCDALSTDQWILCNGRVAPEAALEIARQMVASLAALESVGQVHGDLSVANLLLNPSGNIALQLAGLRPIFRPEEGYAHSTLPIDIYNYLAPERIADGTPPTPASDLYAAGCVWWHLLAGRPPLTGGDSLAKIKAAQEGRVADIRRFAPEVPAPLATAISACCQSDVQRRPASFAALAATLGPSTAQGRTAVAQSVSQYHANRAGLGTTVDRLRQSRYSPVGIAAAAGCLLMAATVTWPMWGDHVAGSLTALVANATEAEAPSPAADPAETPLAGSASAPTVEPPGSDSEWNGAELEKDHIPPANLAQHVPQVDGDLLLPESTTLDASGLPLRAGQTVRPESGGRAHVVVPRTGLRVTVDNVRFENIDFISATASAGQSPSAAGQLLEVAAANVELVRCTFQPADETDRRCTAIVWTETEQPHTFRPEETLRLTHSVLRGVAVGVDQRRSGPARVEIDNCLHLGPGPLWRVAANADDQGTSTLALVRSTLRNAAALADVIDNSQGQARRKLILETSECVFAPQYGAALVRVMRATDATAAADLIEWIGQGSLLATATTPAEWYDSTGEPRPLGDAQLAIEGLVSGKFEFADSSDAGWNASEVRRWTAPLRSTDPPGIRAAALPQRPVSHVVQASYEPSGLE